jgi:hypothetical protein
MAGATSKLSILIEAKNQASGAIKNVESDLKGLDKAASTVAGGLGSLAGAAGVAGIAALGAAAVSATVDMAKAAAETERLGVAFDNLAGQAGQAGDEMLSAMQEAAHGTISNAELMASANRAMLLGVADSADEMAQLMDVASARGKAMGETTAQAFSDIVTGIGRGSALILDNLGIVVDAAKANDVYADSIGKSAAQLTEAEKKQALFNAVIADSTQIIQDNKAAGDDAASNYERMDAALQNAKDSLGEVFSPAIAAIAQSLATAVSQVTSHLDEMGQAADLSDLRTQMEMADQTMAAANREILSLQGRLEDLAAANKIGSEEWLRIVGLLDQAQARYKKAEGATLAYNQALLEANASLVKQEHDTVIADLALGHLTNTLGVVPGAMKAVADQALITGSAMINMGADARAAMEQFNIAMQTSQSIMSEIGSAATQAGVLFAGKQGGDAGLAKQQAVTEELQSQVKVWKEQGYTEKEINDVLLPGMVSSLNEADRATFKVATGTAKISDEAKAAQQAFDDLTNTVAGVLSGALDPGVGVNPDDLLPRADAINEDARRLADVAVNGFASPWAEYFRKEFPDQFQEMAASNDIKTGAAIMLRNFQDGLEPELISKEKVKERVRKMLVGDQNMAALATEIATELSQEMGVPMQEALAATQGAMGGGSGMGTEAATSFADGAAAALDEGNGGGAFVTKFTDQMKASYGLLATAGTEAGKRWGDAFLAKVGESVPPALINILTDLITPQVIAQLGQRGTLTGATP